jgi:hypothetical protein
VLQAIEEQASDAADEDTDIQRRKRLREDRSASLAYDAEQQALRASLLEMVHGAGTSGSVDSGAEDGSDDGSGLKVKTLGKAGPVQVPSSTSLSSLCPHHSALCPHHSAL